MILKTRYGGDAELRAAEYGTAHFIPPPWYGATSAAGQPVTDETASGLPAIGRAIRLCADIIGSTSIGVYRGRKGDKVELPRSGQATLLAAPYPEMGGFQWRYNIAVALEVAENAFIRKIKTSRGRLVALQPIPPRWVNAKLDRNGEKAYEVSTGQGWEMIPASEILHIRGHTIDGGAFGVSRIRQHRDPIGSMQASQRFEGGYFRNHARPDIAIQFPETMTREKAREWRDDFDAVYGGPDNAGKPIPLGGGATIQPIEINLRDAQFIEAKKLNVEEVARIMDIEPTLLGAAAVEQQDVNVMDRFLALQLWPRLKRITDGLKADPDLFPGATYPAFDLDELLFASPLTKAEVQHKQIQSGALLPDEARADNGRPPLPDGVGQIPQVTPVGGGANPQPIPTPSGSSPGAEAEE